MAEKSITNSNSLIDKVVRNIPGVTPELMKGNLPGHFSRRIKRNPGSTTASLINLATGAGMFTPTGVALNLIGSGFDSVNNSNRADEGLQATGIQSTGPMGQDWTTSGVRDFMPGFLGGQEAEDQARDIKEEVAGLRDDWFELDNIDASGALDPSIMVNNSNYGSRTNLDMPDRAHFSIAPPSRSINPTNTAINQFYDKDTKQYVNVVDGTSSPDWNGQPVIDTIAQANQRVRQAPINVQNLPPPQGSRSQWQNPNKPPPLDLNALQAQIDGGGDGMGDAYGGGETFDAGVDTAGDWY